MSSAFPEYADYDALGLAALVRRGDVDAAELLAEAQQRLAAVNPTLNAVIQPMEDYAADLLACLDKQALFGGVPFLAKDLMLPFAGVPLSNGSRAMLDFRPREDGPMAQCLNRAGLITFGKTNTSEFGASALTNPAAFGPTLNPWDTSKNAGGSSGGSSAAVAARVVPMAYSSDGGGSIRLPASYCGIFGFKPSRGINQFEDFSKAWSGAVVSHVSTLSVRDSAAYLDLVSDRVSPAYTVEQSPQDSYLAALQAEDRPLNIGLMSDSPIGKPINQECQTAANHAAALCESLGHRVEPCRWPFDGRRLMRAFLLVVFGFTSKDMQRACELLGVDLAGLDIELNTRFLALAGQGIAPERLENAQKIWQEAAEQMAALHQQYDVLLMPTVPTPPLNTNALDSHPLEQWLVRFFNASGLSKKLVTDTFLEAVIDKSLYQTPYTPVANITGQPAMSVPLHWGPDGLPYGVQFMAARDNDRLLFKLAAQLEAAQPWRGKVPGVHG